MVNISLNLQYNSAVNVGLHRTEPFTNNVRFHDISQFILSHPPEAIRGAT